MKNYGAVFSKYFITVSAKFSGNFTYFQENLAEN